MMLISVIMMWQKKKGGIVQLYRGFRWSVLGGIPSEIVYYLGYTKTKNWLLQTRLGRDNQPAVFFLAGALADVASVLVSVPADIISQRLQLQGGAGIPIRTADRTGLSIARSIIRREGLVGLWRGTGATIAYFAPNSALWWLTHELVKKELTRGNAGGPSESSVHNNVLIASGGVAGLVSGLVTNPLDMIKTRFQCSPSPLSLRTVVVSIWREGGFLRFWSGIFPRLMSAVPRSIGTVVAYERAVEFCCER